MRCLNGVRIAEEDLIETAITKCHARLSGTAVFLASAANGVPLALTQFVKHNHVLHQRVVLVTVLIEEAPRIAPEERAEIIEVVEGITRVILHYGFMQYPTIYEGLRLACAQGKLPGIDLSDITYYIGRETIIPSMTWRAWRYGAKPCSHSCNVTPSAPQRSSACRRGRSSSSAPRSRFRYHSSP
jgi:KUP system potassium uptake protein